MFEKLHKHLEDHNLYPVFQSAYRREHNTETALLRVVDDILHNMNRQHVTIFEFSFLHRGLVHLTCPLESQAQHCSG